MHETLGQRLQAARARLVLSQADLAKASGVPIVTISRLENDRYAERPRQSTVRKLADALGINPTWLLYGESPPRLSLFGSDKPARGRQR